ncbi:unnamed protein product [Caenorhabditis auriculariae]|uniref:Uncharacterized protein n=1 Tax=Caenorhabditis auriculariae TaxID=2777116 RepID=A0A8S1HY38_9PELO|nr:unnamed protein product [Caenorhabditis auriculariae]
MLVRCLLAAALISLVQAKCEDGVDNVIKFSDSTKGKGKVLFKDIEVTTYDDKKKPVCTKSGKALFSLPGHFKLHKGTVEVVEPLTDEPELKLALNVEKDSWMIGVVCENGKSKNQFVPDQLCQYDLCKLAPRVCDLAKLKTGQPIDLTAFVGKDPIDIGALPIPQLGGDWKIGAKIVQNGKTLAGLQLGNGRQWLSIDSKEGAGGAMDFTKLPGQPSFDHGELKRSIAHQLMMRLLIFIITLISLSSVSSQENHKGNIVVDVFHRIQAFFTFICTRCEEVIAMADEAIDNESLRRDADQLCDSSIHQENLQKFCKDVG